MKRNEWMALIVTTFLMFAICLSASAKGKKTVERGMTKQEVMTILGQPKLTSFDAYGDRWDYYKTKVSHPYFMGTLGLKCFVIAHKYKKLTLT